MLFSVAKGRLMNHSRVGLVSLFFSLSLTALAEEQNTLLSPLAVNKNAVNMANQPVPIQNASSDSDLYKKISALDTDLMLALVDRPPVRQRERDKHDDSERDFEPDDVTGFSLWRDVTLKAVLGMSQRTDNVYWSIANDLSGRVGPSVLSELDYKGLRIRGVDLSSSVEFDGGWLEDFFLSGRLFKGTISDGLTRDSDYSGDNRTQEYSRSLSENTGDFVADYSASLGWTVLQVHSFSSALELGYSLHQQHLRKQNAIQVVDQNTSSASIEGLNSTYQSEWQGPWLGLSAELAYERHALKIRSEAHQALYYAEANWNLRDTFMHPKSFDHQAQGQGLVIDASYAYSFDLPQAKKLTLALGYRADRWQAENGRDTLYLATGETVSTRLNQVLWNADTLALSVKFIH